MGIIKDFFSSFISRNTAIDEKFFEHLEEVLVEADTGINSTATVLEYLRGLVKKERLTDGDQIKGYLKDYISSLILTGELVQAPGLKIILFAGINGVGKTTSLAKLAGYLKAQKYKVKIAAGDTFRAAAVDQLSIWAERLGLPIIKAETGSDSGAVVYDSITSALSDRTDYLIIDTAGRMHTNEDLMRELQKIRSICLKRVDAASLETILVIDATAGQNSFIQAETFHRAIPVTGIFLTKYDSAYKGGIIIRITNDLRIPVKFTGFGETLQDISLFDKNRFIESLGL